MACTDHGMDKLTMICLVEEVAMFLDFNFSVRNDVSSQQFAYLEQFHPRHARRPGHVVSPLARDKYQSEHVDRQLPYPAGNTSVILSLVFVFCSRSPFEDE